MEQGPVDRQQLMSSLLLSVKEVVYSVCQKRYGDKRELVIDSDPNVALLCNNWHNILAHGVRQPANVIIKQMTEITGFRNLTLLSPPDHQLSYWPLLTRHMTGDIRDTLLAPSSDEASPPPPAQTTDDCLRCKRWIYCSLNEHSLQRYMQMITDDLFFVRDFYEPWAFMRDHELANTLPSMAAGLGSILFALSLHNSDGSSSADTLGSQKATGAQQQQQQRRKKKRRSVTRNIVDFTNADNTGTHTRLPSLSISRDAPHRTARHASSSSLNDSDTTSEYTSVIDCFQSLLVEYPASSGAADPPAAGHAPESPTLPPTSRYAPSNPQSPLLSPVDETDCSASPNGVVVVEGGGGVDKGKGDALDAPPSQPSPSAQRPPSRQTSTVAAAALDSPTTGDGLKLNGLEDAVTTPTIAQEKSAAEIFATATHTVLRRYDSVTSSIISDASLLEAESDISTSDISSLHNYRTQGDGSPRHNEHDQKMDFLCDRNCMLEERIKHVEKLLEGEVGKNLESKKTCDLMLSSLEEKNSMLSRENDLLKKQIRNYSIPDVDDRSDIESERRLIQMTEMHAELVEFNEVLHKKLFTRDQQIITMTNQIATLHGRIPDCMTSQGNDNKMNISIPLVMKRGSSNEKVFHVYQINIKQGDRHWNVYRRYSDFYNLRNSLIQVFPVIAGFSFPKKKAVGNKSEKCVKERQPVLEKFLRLALCVVISNDSVDQDHWGAERLFDVIPFFSDIYRNATQNQHNVDTSINM